MNRRSFISGLIRVGSFVAFDPHRVIFDMGWKLFLPQRFYDADTFMEVIDLNLGPSSPIFFMSAAQVKMHRMGLMRLEVQEPFFASPMRDLMNAEQREAWDSVLSPVLSPRSRRTS
jgi:hypothetical protein